MTNSPYRQTQRPSITVHGEPSISIFLWAAWLTAAGLVVTILFVDDLHRASVAFLAIGAAVLGAVALLHRAAGRVRWRLTLHGSQLHIERRSGASAKTVVLELEGGIALALSLTDGTGRVDPCIVLVAGTTRVSMTAGVRPAATLDRLVAFLRDHDVAVKHLPAGPFVWSGGGSGPYGF